MLVEENGPFFTAQPTIALSIIRRAVGGSQDVTEIGIVRATQRGKRARSEATMLNTVL